MQCFDCTLWEFLKDDNQYSITLVERVQLLMEIIVVIIFIQKAGYCHRDIKPSNILVKTKKLQNNSKLGLDSWALSDFGLAGKLTDLNGSAGTAGFAAMEQFDGQTHQKSDNYSLSKMAVLILIPWNIGWSVLAYPLNDAEYQSFRWKNNDLFKILSELVFVSYFFLYYFFTNLFIPNHFS